MGKCSRHRRKVRTHPPHLSIPAPQVAWLPLSRAMRGANSPIYIHLIMRATKALPVTAGKGLLSWCGAKEKTGQRWPVLVVSKGCRILVVVVMYSKERAGLVLAVLASSIVVIAVVPGMVATVGNSLSGL